MTYFIFQNSDIKLSFLTEYYFNLILIISLIYKHEMKNKKNEILMNYLYIFLMCQFNSFDVTDFIF